MTFLCKFCGNVWNSKESIVMFRHCPKCASSEFIEIDLKINKKKLNKVILDILNEATQNPRFVFANKHLAEQISKGVLNFITGE